MVQSFEYGGVRGLIFISVVERDISAKDSSLDLNQPFHVKYEELQ